MTQSATTIRPGAHNGAQLVAPRRRSRMGETRSSSQGWTPPDRAPALRRVAQQAEARGDVDLARRLRARATEIELGPDARDEFEQLLDTLR